MSALDHSGHFVKAGRCPLYPPKADTAQHVRFVPIADIDCPNRLELAFAEGKSEK
jgi:hypothetical protein